MGPDRWARREHHWRTTAGPAVPPYLWAPDEDIGLHLAELTAIRSPPRRRRLQIRRVRCTIALRAAAGRSHHRRTARVNLPRADGPAPHHTSRPRRRPPR